MFQIRVEQSGEDVNTKEEEIPLALNDAKYNDKDGIEDINGDEVLEFNTGNPQLQISTGKLRFYRPNDKNTIGTNGYVANSMAAHVLPTERNTLVCIVAVPPHMSPVELLGFLHSFSDDLELVRILNDPQRSHCMALIKFNAQERADEFYLAHNGMSFNSIEPERCKIVFVRSVEFLTQSTNESINGDEMQKEETKTLGDIPSENSSRLFPLPPPGMTEIPTCVVCLDRLEASASGILTTLCNHSFHCACLYRWEGSSCPVCRYSHGDVNSACEVCHTSEHLWICLICGHVGCGRYQGEHAKQHYQDTKHTYSLELETQRVWDYAGDGYVHRLILNKQDGKFVEFPHPMQSITSNGERSQIPARTSAEDEAYEHQKLEKLAVEYNFLLKSQLEEQRLFYERRMKSLQDCHSRQVVHGLEQENKHLKKKNETLQAKADKLETELTFVRELNQSLLENQKVWKERVNALEKKCDTLDTDASSRIMELEGQVRDLMFYLDTQNKVEQSMHKDDIQGGTVEIRSHEQGQPSQGTKEKASAHKRKSKSKKR